MEKLKYHGWNCYRLENQYYELFVTADAGPRIIHFSFKGEKNIFKVFDSEIGEIISDGWHLMGGHRLWHAPEAIPRSYIPDNDSPEVQVVGKAIRFTGRIEKETGFQKEIEILLEEDGDEVIVTHRLTNHNLWSIRTAAWALSVMAEGGTDILPLPPRGKHEDQNLYPCNVLTMWPYTDLSDERYSLGKEYILFTNTPGKGEGQKIGLSVPAGWIACAVNNSLFVKRFSYDPYAEYPDHGCNAEVFTNADILELETLGPIESIKPGEFIEHVEKWQLFSDVKAPQNDEDVVNMILPLLK